jgi:hypothetical protein
MNLDTFKAMSNEELPEEVEFRLPAYEVWQRFLGKQWFERAKSEAREMIASRGYALMEFFDERTREHVFLATKWRGSQARPADVRPLGEVGAARRALPGPAPGVAHEPVWQGPGRTGSVGDPSK